MRRATRRGVGMTRVWGCFGGGRVRGYCVASMCVAVLLCCVLWYSWYSSGSSRSRVTTVSDVVRGAVCDFVAGVPVFGESKDVFAAYEEGLSKEVEEQERVRMVAKELSKKGDDAEGKKRAAASKGTTSDLGRGRWLSSVRAVVDCCARDAEALGARGALAACQVRCRLVVFCVSLFLWMSLWVGCCVAVLLCCCVAVLLCCC